ncbi:MAG: hypothetical protein AB7E31_16360 [Desulfitobacterium sp.]
MRKRIFVSLITMLLLLSNTVVASAQVLVSPEQVNLNRIVKTTNYNVEKDIGKLYERAKKGISDLPASKGKAHLKNTDYLSSKELVTVETAQLVKKEMTSDNEVINTYTKTSFAELDVKDTDELEAATNSDISPMSVVGDYDDEFDNSISCLAYSTIVYEVLISPAKYRFKINQVSGGWIINDPKVSFTGYKRLSTSAHGSAIDTVTPDAINYGTTIIDPAAQSFTSTYYIADRYVYYVPGGAFLLVLRANMQAGLKHASSNWIFSWDHEVVRY